jgi:hypothetical protein
VTEKCSDYREMDVEGPLLVGQTCVKMSGRLHAENRLPDSRKEEVAMSVAEKANLQDETDENAGESKHSPKLTKKMKLERLGDHNKERTRSAISKTSSM